MALQSMLTCGYDGELYPVNPNAVEIQGRRAFADLDSIPGEIDLTVCSLPFEKVFAAAQACAARGVAGMVIYAAGFAEAGDEGAAMQARLTALSAQTGMRILGPNSLGLVNYGNRTIASFHSVFAQGLPAPGRVSVVSQSGAFLGVVAMMGQERGIGFSHLIATGNEADLQLADCLEYLADDDSTDVVMCYMETCRDGARLKRALSLAQERGKKLVVVKPGRTTAGARAAQSHTAALAGDDTIYDALFQQYGVYRADSVEEYFDIGIAAAQAPTPLNNHVCLVSISGGIGVLLADHAEISGLEVSELPPAARKDIQALIPLSETANPVDVTGAAVDNPALFGGVLKALAKHQHYGSVVVYYGGYLRTQAQVDTQTAVWNEFRRRSPQTALAVTGFLSPAAYSAAQAAGVLAYREPTDAIRALAGLSWLARRSAHSSVDAPRALIAAPPPGHVDESVALQWIAQCGIRVVPHRVAADEAAAEAAAREFGYPVVLKVVADGVIHKSDVQGVRLGLRNDDELRSAFRDIVTCVGRAKPEASIQGCLVAPMVNKGVEVVVGMVRDASFGPVMMFGLGGVLVEVLGDVAFRLAPFDREVAHRMITQIRGGQILAGVRGQPPADVNALADALASLSELAASAPPQVRSFEINPLRVFPCGQGVLALDAVVELG